MTKFIITISLCLICSFSFAQSRFTTKDSLNAVCDKVMQTLVDGKYSAAIQMLKGRSVMDGTVVDNIDKTLNEQMANILPYYGKIMAYELVDERFLKNTVTRRRYILQFEFYFLSFDFVLYNNTKGWSVSHFYYKDETKELF